MRLNKYIANAGVCSRREADEYIKRGEISVNGKKISELGYKISPTDDVYLRGELLQHERKVYILLNKPKDYISTVEDPHAKRTVMELIAGACTERVYPVGRLDRNTTGLLLFTNDGDLTKKLTHPKHKKRKIYYAELDREVTRADMQKMLEGVDLEDGKMYVDAIDYVQGEDKTQVGVEIHSGQNRIVRRLFEHFEYKVSRLDRVYFAGLTKKGLSRGRWRFLSDKELSLLKRGAFL